jgi:hypothetical protein
MVSLLDIRTLLEDQIDSGVTSSGTDPSASLLNSYINEAILECVIELKPRELRSATASSINITSGQNTATFPTGLVVPEIVYISDSNSKYRELQQKRLKDMIEITGASAFFDTNNSGTPCFYSVRGGTMTFDKYFDYTISDGIKVYGLNYPTVLSADVDETELPLTYKLLIVYKAAVLFYQKDDDVNNQQKFMMLAREKADKLSAGLDVNDSDYITLDPRSFGEFNRSISNPSVFFS